MFKQVQFSYDNTIATPSGEVWNPINVAGYDTIVVTLEAPTGWIGTISFWGGANNNQYSAALWSLNDAEDASLVSQVETISGATPSAYAHNFRGSIAGLAEFGIYFADPISNVIAVGEFNVSVGLYSSAK
jgi:hypothetical protein